MPRKLPTGTVTFLFTDIEGSTRLLKELGDAYGAVQTDHMRLMREAIATGEGTEVGTEGDSFFAAFPTARGAVRAAVTAQRRLHERNWSHGRPLRVRMGMHTGEARLGGDNYLGIDVNRAARIAAAGHGGQVLISDTTRSLVENELAAGVSVRDLGRHRLKDFDEPQHLYDLVIDGLPSEFPAPKTLEVPTNLPVMLTSFIGRGRELEAITALLDGTRLVTLTGPGGTGKTRLAVEAARRLAERFPDGTYLADLSPITDPRLVPDTIASALGLRQESGAPVLELITDHLRDRAALLVLDNFEQVLDAADTAVTIIRAAPRVRCLVTSRAPLGISGEREIAVQPLEILERTADAAALRQSAAVALFADRAGLIDANFSLTDDDLPIVAEICARLDGLPLAIELAASRLRVIPLRSMVEQLDRRLSTLVGGPRDAPRRQRTLRSTIAWSYDLLDADAAVFFRRLGVFAGGWSLDGAHDVAAQGASLDDAVALTDALVQHSLVRRAHEAAEDRFRMLETIREFALERLAESREAGEIRSAHARHFLHLAEEAAQHLRGRDHARWLDALEADQDNLRAALSWSIESQDAQTGLRLVAALWVFWHPRGRLTEGRRWIDAMLELPGGDATRAFRAAALTGLGGISYWQNDFETSVAAYEQALELYRELDDRRASVEALFNLGATRAVVGDPVAKSLIEESLALARELGDRRGEAWGLWAMGAVGMFGGDLESSLAYSRESVPIFEEAGDRWGLMNALTAVGGVTAVVGKPAEARPWLLQALEVSEELRHPLAAANVVDVLGRVDSAAGRHERALRLSGAAAAARDRLKGGGPAAFMPFPDPRDAAAASLDADAIQNEWSAGAAMSLEEAIAYARAGD
jgi:predicted ATPase/class 3 adenylate cyclase